MQSKKINYIPLYRPLFCHQLTMLKHIFYSLLCKWQQKQLDVFLVQSRTPRAKQSQCFRHNNHLIGMNVGVIVKNIYLHYPLWRFKSVLILEVTNILWPLPCLDWSFPCQSDQN